MFILVVFLEDTPKKGFFALHLGVKDLRVNKALFGLGKSTPKNAQINPTFSAQYENYFISFCFKELSMIYIYTRFKAGQLLKSSRH